MFYVAVTGFVHCVAFVVEHNKHLVHVWNKVTFIQNTQRRDSSFHGVTYDLIQSIYT